MGLQRHEHATEAAAAAARIRGRNPEHKLPTWPYGTITHLTTLPAHPDDILDALTALVALRHLLNWIEFRHLRRATHAHYVIPTSQHKIAGDILGISSSGLTRRRRRLAHTIAEQRHVKNSPQLPRITLDAAATATTLILEHREGLVPSPPPPPEDLIGVAHYAAAWPDTPDLHELVADIQAALTIAVCLRRHLDDIEADLLDLGRALKISNVDLGKPLGRFSKRATWKARVRPRNGDRAGRRRRVQAPIVDAPVDIQEAVSLDTDLTVQLRTFIDQLLTYRPLINDEDLDMWMDWLAEHAAKPPTDHTLSLLAVAADEIAEAPYAQKINGLPELVQDILKWVKAHRR